MNSENLEKVKDLVSEDTIDKAKEFLNSEQGEKIKDAVSDIAEKIFNKDGDKK